MNEEEMSSIEKQPIHLSLTFIIVTLTENLKQQNNNHYV